MKYIGKGSYGMVYQAFDQKTKQIVVVKQARNRKKKEREGYLQREAATLSSLHHHGIPAFIDFFQETKKSFLVMQWIKGDNVEDHIFRDGTQYTERESLHLLLKVLAIVKYLHDQQIIHRDLRIPNIIIDGEAVYIIDFGLSIRSSEKIEPKSLEGMTLEKRLYRAVHVTSDFYALGHFLLFLLYSSYKTNSSKEQSWEQELSIHPQTKHLVSMLLKEDSSFENVEEIIRDIKIILSQL
ncbi:serine/threonine protein kinase [Bacillus mesophilus]|nr:protein kinase family protein [Bacillus mesophilus]